MERKRKAYRLVTLDKVIPNPWNPNEMPPALYEKLKRGLERTLDTTDGKIMPIVVRKHPDREGCYEIIDGFHRWKAFGELGQEKIGVWVIKASDKDARILTNTLNYLRGQPHRERYSKSIIEMLEKGATFEELAELLPENEDEIGQLIDESKVTIEAFKALQENEEEEAENLDSVAKQDEDVWIDLKFKVTASQARIIEAEIKRIGSHIKGKNARARALEFMAVQSSQDELSEV